MEPRVYDYTLQASRRAPSLKPRPFDCAQGRPEHRRRASPEPRHKTNDPPEQLCQSRSRAGFGIVRVTNPAGHGAAADTLFLNLPVSPSGSSCPCWRVPRRAAIRLKPNRRPRMRPSSSCPPADNAFPASSARARSSPILPATVTGGSAARGGCVQPPIRLHVSGGDDEHHLHRQRLARPADGLLVHGHARRSDAQRP